MKAGDYRTMAPEEKVFFTDSFFDGDVPTYMWYAVGNIRETNAEPIVKQTGCPRQEGAIELHELSCSLSATVPPYSRPGSVFEDLEGQVALRVREPTTIKPVLDVGGMQAELYHVSEPSCRQCVNFAKGEAWGPEDKRPMAEAYGLEYHLNGR